MKDAKRTLSLMGTVIQLWVQHEEAEQLIDTAEQQLVSYEKRFSANDVNSHLMAINQRAGKSPVQVEQDLFELIRIGKEQSLKKNSMLNIAIGPLIQEWRIGFQDAKYPSANKIAALLPLIDPQAIQLSEAQQTVFLQHTGMAIDLGALAKGYFADKVIGYFKAAGAAAALIDLGGNVLTFGAAPAREDGLWRVGIQHPFLPRGNYAAIVKSGNQSVVTSGIYERTFEWEGQTYHHIFDSQTGYPVKTDLASVTIVSKQSLDGEIWTTRLFGKQPAEIIAELNQVKELEALVITKAGQLAYTKGLPIEMPQ